jgi:hypothetical protein
MEQVALGWIKLLVATLAAAFVVEAAQVSYLFDASQAHGCVVANPTEAALRGAFAICVG